MSNARSKAAGRPENIICALLIVVLAVVLRDSYTGAFPLASAILLLLASLPLVVFMAWSAATPPGMQKSDDLLAEDDYARSSESSRSTDAREISTSRGAGPSSPLPPKIRRTQFRE